MTQIKKDGCQYIEHHGMKIREDQLVKMAKQAVIYADAKPYIESILYHAVKYKVWDLIYKVMEIWDFYGVKPYSLPDGDEEEVVATPRDNRQMIEKRVKQQYKAMSEQLRIDAIRLSIEKLRAEYPRLFRFRNQWQGIYLVIRDRLEHGMSQSDFGAIAYMITPADMPEKIKFNENVMKNLSRDFQYGEIEELTYYELDYNPHKDLCNVFWEVIIDQIMNIKDGEMTELD